MSNKSRLTKYLLALATAGVFTAAAAGNTYRVNILEDTTVEGKPLKAGDYKIQLENNTATLKRGKDVLTVPAHVEQAPSKYSGTQIRYVENAVQEIHIGGSTTRIIFSGENGNGSQTAGQGK